jgi:hypothetical protein
MSGGSEDALQLPPNPAPGGRRPGHNFRVTVTACRDGAGVCRHLLATVLRLAIVRGAVVAAERQGRYPDGERMASPRDLVAYVDIDDHARPVLRLEAYSDD